MKNIMNKLYGFNIDPLLKSFNSSTQKKAIKKFDKVISTIETAERKKRNCSYLKEIENILRRKYKMGFKANGLNPFINFNRVVNFCNKYPHSGLYFKKTTTVKILNTLPPKNLMSFLKVKNISDLISTMTPRQALSLTRHTESKKWINDYLLLIKEIEPHDFSIQKIEYFPVTKNDYPHIFKAFNITKKPWLMSHCKETGVILHFIDNQPRFKTPIVLSAAVYMHYFFETRYASIFFSRIIKQEPKKIGLRLLKLFSRKKKFKKFHDANLYSENLFWEETIESLCKLIDAKNFKIDPYHFVDDLWNLNFNNKSEKITYHSKEMLWCHIAQELAGLSQNKMKNLILSNLDQGGEKNTKIIINEQKNH